MVFDVEKSQDNIEEGYRDEDIDQSDVNEDQFNSIIRAAAPIGNAR